MSAATNNNSYLILHNVHLPFLDIDNESGAWPHTYLNVLSQHLPDNLGVSPDMADTTVPTMVAGDVNSRSLCDKSSPQQRKDTPLTWPVTPDGSFDDSLRSEGKVTNQCTCPLFVPRHVPLSNDHSQTQQDLYNSDSIMIFRDKSLFQDISPITFMPTYKVHDNKYRLSKEGKLRLPGYADRILCNQEMQKQQCPLFIRYQSLENTSTDLFGMAPHDICPCSPKILEYDHRPVYGNVRWQGVIDIHIYTWNMGTGDRTYRTAKQFMTHQLKQHTSDAPVICVFCFQETERRKNRSTWKTPSIGDWRTSRHGMAFGRLSDYTIRTYTYWKNIQIPDPNHQHHQVSTTAKDWTRIIKRSLQTSEKWGTKGSLMTVFELPGDERTRLQNPVSRSR